MKHYATLEHTVVAGTYIVSWSDISSIDHLIMREFVGGPPRYHLAIKGVREQFVVVEQNSGPSNFRIRFLGPLPQISLSGSLVLVAVYSSHLERFGSHAH